MSDLIERIKQSVKKHSYHIVHGINNHDEGMTVQGFYQVIDEELAKEPHECNSDLISKKKLIRDLFYSADGNRYPTRDCDNFPITISFEDLRKAINNQQQVQPIVRSAEEVVEMLNKISCSECEKNSSHCHFSEKDCKNYWFEWLTKKEV